LAPKKKKKLKFLGKNLIKRSWAWWYTPVILALRTLRQEDQEFKVSLGHIERPCLKKKIIQQKQKTYMVFTLKTKTFC
jgi:hypothetical protein